MYSYEDRMRAVALYIKLGKRPKATIRQLGYPGKNALKGWYLEYEHLLDLRLGFAPRAPKFTQAQKEAAVEHYLLKKANEILKNTHGLLARLCAVETHCAILLIRGELPMSYWRHLTPLKNVANGLLRT
jgi:transposase-like protein